MSLALHPQQLVQLTIYTLVCRVNRFGEHLLTLHCVRTSLKNIELFVSKNKKLTVFSQDGDRIPNQRMRSPAEAVIRAGWASVDDV
jgi:hypothetical protein